MQGASGATGYYFFVYKKSSLASIGLGGFYVFKTK
jgi:hypothetical protein